MPQEEPTIHLIDIVPDTASALAKLPGIRFVPGSFGSPYAVEVGSGMRSLDFDDVSLSNYKEADGFVIDLRELDPRTDIRYAPPPERVTRDFTSGVDGLVDPRPYVMSLVANGFKRISEHGGLFVVFAQPIETIKYVRGHIKYDRLEAAAEFRCSNYSFLPILTDNLEIIEDHGTEMSALSTDNAIGHLLAGHLAGGSFTCTLRDQTNW